jgi:hypothetical protein
MKVEKFDLGKALNGAKVVTRNGIEVKQLHKFITIDKMKLYGVVEKEVNCWTKEGRYQCPDMPEFDLFLAVEPQSIWVNVYIFHDTIQTVGNFNTLEAAKKSIDQKLNFIKTIEITDEL